MLIHEFLQGIRQNGPLIQSEQDILIGNSGKICAQGRRDRSKTMLEYIFQLMDNPSPGFPEFFLSFSEFFPGFFPSLIFPHGALSSRHPSF